MQFSDWLLVCTLLLALFLALAKRRHELVTLTTATEHREILAEYSPYLLDQMIAVVTASCLMAYAFYTTGPGNGREVPHRPPLLDDPFRALRHLPVSLPGARKEQGGSPTDMLLTDRPLLVDVALWALAIVAIVYTRGRARAAVR